VEREASSQDSAAAGLAMLSTMEREESGNGGFPEPPEGGVVRVVRARHEACGRDTPIRLPGALPTGAVRRVLCQGCAQAFEPPSVEEIELVEPARVEEAEAPEETEAPQPPSSEPRRFSLPGWLPDPRGLSWHYSGSRTWRYLSIPVAAIAVVAGLIAIQGGSDDSDVPFQAIAPAADAVDEGAPTAGGGQGAKGSSADLVRESSFSLALPDGWQRTDAGAGATFAAISPGGGADATLWVQRDPKLSFPRFEARSLDQLRSLAGSARVVERVAAPTADATVIRLGADAPEGSPQYEVTLRASGPYRYYLSTTVQPDAPRAEVEGAELVHGSFLPSGAAAARDAGGQG
jgi:hypothetical protein